MSFRFAFFVILVVGLAITGCGSSHTGDTPTASPVIYSADQDLTISVPSMSCPKGCYPTVKETLEKQPGVKAVELYPQAKPNEINDRRVRVSLSGPFDATKAIAALAEENFDGAKVEEGKREAAQ